MKKLLISLVALLGLAIAVPAQAAVPPDLPDSVRTPILSKAVCTKKVCRVTATCPPEGGGEENVPGTFQDGRPDPCAFEVSLFGKKPLIGRVNRDVFGYENRASSEVTIAPGATQVTRWKVTPFGRRNITRLLSSGKRKVKGEWEIAAFWRLIYIHDDGSLTPTTHYGSRTGPITFKIK